MAEKQILVTAGAGLLIGALLVVMFYAKLLAVNAVRQWMPNGKWRLALLDGHENLPSIRDHFGAITLLIARGTLWVLATLLAIAVIWGVASFAASIPIWAFVIIVILLLK